MRTVSLRLVDLIKNPISIGFVGENVHTQIQVDCKKVFDEYPTAVASLAVRSPGNLSPYPAVVERNGDVVIWTVRDSDLVHEGNGELQLSFAVDEVVVKSYVGRTKVLRSIMPTGDVPDKIDDWITQANALLGEKGKPNGIAGLDENGKVPVSQLPDVAVAVEDVQIEETSIVNENGIAEIPLAKTTKVGLVKPNIEGMRVAEDGAIAIKPGEDYSYKRGVSTYSPVTASTQHKGVFYGLAKAAGHDEKDSEEEFGTYTSKAKAAIRQMIGAGTLSQETDPTVPEWAKQPNKPTYTAQEVGALPANTPIPDPTSIIDDTAEAGDTNKTFSADKLTAEFSDVKSALNDLDSNLISTLFNTDGDLFESSFTIEQAMIDSTGTIVYTTLYDFVIYPVTSGTTISKIVSNASVYGGFFSGDTIPEIGSVSYDESRFGDGTNSTLNGIPVPDDVKWVGVRRSRSNDTKVRLYQSRKIKYLQNGDDINDCIEPGFYYYQAYNITASHCPTTSQGGWIIPFVHYAGTIAAQIYICDRNGAENGNTFVRIYRNSAFGDWKRFLFASEIAGILSDVDALKSVVENIEDAELITFTPDYYINTSASVGSTVDLTPVASSTGYSYAIVNCEHGDKFTVTGTGGSSPRLWAFVDSNNVKLDGSGGSASATGRVITAPQNAAKCIINLNSSGGECYKGEYINAKKAIQKLTKHELTITYDKDNLAWNYGIVITSSGAETDNSSYSSTGFVELPDLLGDTAYYIVPVSSASYSSIAFFDASKTFISGTWSNATATEKNITIPSNAKYFRLSCLNANIGITYFTIQTDSKEFFERKIRTIEDDAEKLGNLLPDKDSGSSGGITFTRLAYGHFLYNGDCDGSTNFNILSSTGGLPHGFKAGKKYLLKYFTSIPYLYVRVYLYYSDGTNSKVYEGSKGAEITFPSNTIGIIVRFYGGSDLASVTAVNEHVEIAMYDAESPIGISMKNYVWKPRPMLTICDDDGNIKFYSQLLPLIEEYGAPIASANATLHTEIRDATDALYQARIDYAAGKITAQELADVQDRFDALRAEDYVTSEAENYGERFMSWAQVEECYEKGAEIVSHTYGHFIQNEDMSMPDNVVRGMYIKSRHMLERHGIPCKTVVYTGTSENYLKTRNSAQYAFDYGVRASGEVLNQVGGDPMQIRRYGIDDWSEASLKALCDTLLTVPTGWMVWTIHTSNASWDQDKVDAIEMVMQYCAEKNIPIVTYAMATHWYYELGYQPGMVGGSVAQS